MKNLYRDEAVTKLKADLAAAEAREKALEAERAELWGLLNRVRRVYSNTKGLGLLSQELYNEICTALGGDDGGD